MSTPITEIPRSMSSEMITQDSIPLPTPKVPTPDQGEKELMSAADIIDDVLTILPIFNLNRANARAASSVSSLEEGEGILNDDKYERAIQRIEKLNKKITILVKNWNKESKLAKNYNKVVEIDKFYRPYMDQYNARQRALERLMEMYDEHCTNTIPMETPQQKNRIERQTPQTTYPVNQTPFWETTPIDVPDRRKQTYENFKLKETSIKKGMDGSPSTVVSSDTLRVSTINSTIPITTMSSIFSSSSTGPATESLKNRRIPSQGRISTLSSVVRPMPTTATRTIAITREES